MDPAEREHRGRDGLRKMIRSRHRSAHMRPTLPALVSLALACGAPTDAVDAADRHLRVELGSVHASHANDGDSTVSVLGSIGWRWRRFGLEVGLQQARGIEREFDDSGVDGGVFDFDQDALALRFGGTLRQPLGENVFLGARAGVMLWSLDGDVEICGGGLVTPFTCSRSSFDRSGADYYLGAELGYDIGAHWNLGLGWEHQHYGIGFDYARAGESGMTLRSISLTSEYRF
jgi:hypothetical protein